MMMGAHSLNNHQGTLEFVPAVWRNGWLVGWPGTSTSSSASPTTVGEERKRRG